MTFLVKANARRSTGGTPVHQEIVPDAGRRVAPAVVNPGGVYDLNQG
jgi:hypothetical protein